MAHSVRPDWGEAIQMFYTEMAIYRAILGRTGNRRNTKKTKGGDCETTRPEPPVFTHLSLARASMKIWCIFKCDTAIKWRELLVVDEPSPLASAAHNIFGGIPVGVTV